MEDNKKASKASVKKHFPGNQSKKYDALSDLLPPKSQMRESFRELGYKGQGLNVQSATPEGYSKGKDTAHSNGVQKSDNAVMFYEVSEPSFLSSSVDYGCRENYYRSATTNRHPGSSYDKDQKDDYPDPKHSRGEWWQGSLYY